MPLRSPVCFQKEIQYNFNLEFRLHPLPWLWRIIDTTRREMWIRRGPV